MISTLAPPPRATSAPSARLGLGNDDHKPGFRAHDNKLPLDLPDVPPASLGVIGVSYDWPVPLMSLSGPRSLTITKSVGGTG